MNSNSSDNSNETINKLNIESLNLKFKYDQLKTELENVYYNN